MTTDDLERSEKRLMTAKLLVRRINNLREAVDRLKANAIRSVWAEIVEGDNPIHYRANGHDGWCDVCWSPREVGLAGELRDAILGVVERRLQAALNDLDAL
jgi:hypothetical protein